MSVHDIVIIVILTRNNACTTMSVTLTVESRASSAHLSFQPLPYGSQSSKSRQLRADVGLHREGKPIIQQKRSNAAFSPRCEVKSRVCCGAFAEQPATNLDCTTVRDQLGQQVILLLAITPGFTYVSVVQEQGLCQTPISGQTLQGHCSNFRILAFRFMMTRCLC